jgi:lysophospholipid acyltransferase (LPLAT)-like uncharacterized protein
LTDLKFETVGLIGKWLLGALFLTTRVERIGTEYFERFRDRGKPVIFVSWHGQLLSLVSSTRGATKGLKGLVRAARAGHDLGLTPDGPRGPPGVLKPGALAVAQITGLPIIPIGVGASHGWRLRSWDGFLIPKPFSKVSVEYLPPTFVPRDASRRDLEELAAQIGNELNSVSQRLGSPVLSPEPDR